MHINVGDKMCSRGNVHSKHCTKLERFCAREIKHYCVIFPQHTPLQLSTLRPQKLIPWDEKWEYFHFWCFKVSTFAHRSEMLCNTAQGRGKTSNITDCCLLAAQIWTALVAFKSYSSDLSHFLFSAAQMLLLNRTTTIRCKRKYWKWEEEWIKCMFWLAVTVKMALAGN